MDRGCCALGVLCDHRLRLDFHLMPKYRASIRHVSPPRSGEDAFSLGEITAQNAEEAHRAIQQKLRSENALLHYGDGRYQGVSGTVELRQAA